jgi:hypothetical protein
MQHVILPGPIKWQCGGASYEYIPYTVTTIDYTQGGEMQYRSERVQYLDTGFWNFNDDYATFLNNQWQRA